MMKTINLLLIMSVFMIGIGCSKEAPEISKKDPEISKDKLYPTDVIATDFVLPSGVTWQNMQYDSVYSINSQEEMVQHLSSTTDVPIVDFTQHSLVVVLGANNSGIESISSQMQQTATNSYTLTISIKSNAAAVAQRWNVAKLIPKHEKDAVVTLIIENDKDSEISYPIDIATTDYMLPDGVAWQNIQQDSVYIIDSQEKLSQYLSSTTDISKVDFEKYSLVVVWGGSTSGIDGIVSQLQQIEANTYQFTINIKSNATAVAQKWTVAKLVPKLNKNTMIELKVNKEVINNETIVYPVEIETNDYSLTIPNCNWANVKTDILYIFNSTEETLGYLSCKDDNPTFVNFNEYSLLYVRGGTKSGIHSISRDLQQISVNEYKLTIDIMLDMTDIAQGWSIAVLTPKLPQNSVVKLDLKQHH